MNIVDIMLETIHSLAMNKGRSALTILGIVVGIASVIIMVSVGQGSKASIEDSIREVGSNLITVSSRSQSGAGLTMDDAQAIADEVPVVSSVAPLVSSQYTVTNGTGTMTVSVSGVDGAYGGIKNLDMSSGAFISAYDDSIDAHVAVLGPDVVTELWSEGYDPVGEQVRINGVLFTVSGVTQSKGGTSSSNADEAVYVPLSTAQRVLTGAGSLSTLNVAVDSEDDMELAKTQIEALLTLRHDIGTDETADFTVVSQADLLDMASTVTDTLTLLLAAIASISLVVGGIGIMNMMLTSVTERIREIGLRKAIGATPSNITLQFLVEAVALTVLGGFFGVAIGWGGAQIIQLTGLMETAVTLSPVLIAVGVCTLIGLVFGFYPARRAAKLDPIEALRYQ